jgi:hypothetical protein
MKIRCIATKSYSKSREKQFTMVECGCRGGSARMQDPPPCSPTSRNTIRKRYNIFGAPMVLPREKIQTTGFFYVCSLSSFIEYINKEGQDHPPFQKKLKPYTMQEKKWGSNQANSCRCKRTN